MPIPKPASHKDAKVDEAIKGSFPASDPPASGKATSTEPPARPVNRKASIIRREDVESAQRDEGHNT